VDNLQNNVDNDNLQNNVDNNNLVLSNQPTNENNNNNSSNSNRSDDYGIESDDETINSTAVNVNDVTFDQFRHSLIEHFDILFHRRKLIRPSRLDLGHFVYNRKGATNLR
jgi:hypothetical protein